MKMEQDHIVPLSTQVIEILKKLKVISGTSQYVFPGEYKEATKTMNTNALPGVSL